MGRGWIDKMKINLANWEHKNLNSKKLPSEEDLEDFFSCFITDSIPQGKGFFDNVPKFDYTQEARGRYSDSRYPVIMTDDAWITPSLNQLDPSIRLSSSEHAIIGDEDYNKATISTRSVPALGMSLPLQVTSEISNANDHNVLSNQWVIKNFTDLSSITYSVNNFIKHFATHECEVFKKGLEQKGYIQLSTHQEILEKLEKIRTAKPRDNIYIIAEKSLLDYLMVHCPVPGELMQNCWLVSDNYSTYAYSTKDNKFSNFKSAIFTTNSMSARHEFDLYYKLRRENRKWTVYVGIVGRVGIEVPENPLKEKDSKIVLNDSHPRWDRLF